MRYWPAFLFLVLSSRYFAQNVPVIHFTEKDGLPHAIVYRVFQDKQGYIWFSTDNGLSRYDGTRFTNFYAEDGLGSSFIFGMEQEEDGSLLIAAYENGVVNYRNKRFEKKREYSSASYPIDFYRTRKGLFIINRILQAFYHNKPLRDEKGKMAVVSDILECRDGKIIAIGDGIYTYSGKKRKLIRTLNLKQKKYYLNAIEQLASGSFVATENNGIYRISNDLTTTQLVVKGKFASSRKSIYKDKSNNIWVADITGKLWLFSPDLKRKRIILDDVIVNQILEDNNGNIWLATYGNGVYCIPNPSIRITNVRGELVKELGVLTFSGKKYCIPLIQKDYEINCSHNLQHYSKLIPRDFFTYENGIIYAGVEEYAIACRASMFFYRNNRLISKELNLFSKSITKVIRSSKGEYWIGTRSGLLRLSKNLSSITLIPSLDNIIVYDLCETTNGNVVIASSNGVYLSDGKRWSRFGLASGLSSLIINTVGYQKNQKKIWVGTNRGVYFMRHEGSFMRLRALNHTRCNDIVVDKKQRVWLATVEGLYAQDNKHLYVFGKLFGAQSGIRKIAYDEQSDALFALLYDQFLEIPIKELMRKQPVQNATIQIDEVFIDAKKATHHNHFYTFSDNNRNLTIDFSYPDFNLSTRNRIYYRLNDDILIPVNDQHSVNLYNLPYGENEVELLVMDLNSTIVASRKIKISYPQPFYKSNWFILTIFVIIFAVAIVLMRNYLYRKHLKKQRSYDTQQQLAELRQKSLQNMLNPHFLNNAINSIQAFVVRNDQRNTLRYLSKLAKLMRLNLELLESSFVSIKKELDNIELYLHFEQIRSGDKLLYQLEVDESLDLEKLLIPAFILQPYVENAIWHGILPKESAGTILIAVEKLENGIQLTITDDGIGIEASTKRKKNTHKISRGTRIIQERLAILDKKLPGFSVSISELKGFSKTGTKIVLKIPFIYSELDVTHKNPT